VRFKLDENMPREIALYLRSSGHDASTVLDEQLGGKPDPMIAEAAREEERILATLDRDFADLRKYKPSRFHGLLVFRVVRQDPEYLVPIWRRLLSLLDTRDVRGELWIVGDHGVRRRTGGFG
jgi:predicted nuclease of predicted toxin-antitoxin system